MKIAVAQDEAFNFTYKANIDALKQEGEVVFFSPLKDRQLPECDLLYLPGGYPELFAEQLAANTTMRESIKDYAEKGGKIFAECGGFMYLCKGIDGKAMCGVLSMEATMEGAKLHLGYRQMEWNGTPLRGHEFHYSDLKPEQKIPNAIEIIKQQQTASGKTVGTAVYRYKNVIAGYTHWYWAEKGLSIFNLY